VNEIERRLTDRVRALAAVSDEGPGVTRLAFGQREREAHAMVAGWAAADGARVLTDEVGNTVLVYGEGEPYLMVGSHLDSVAAGGRYDGVIGVLAALELAPAVVPDIGLGLRVVAFSAEEGARFGHPCLGSGLASGELSAGSLRSLYDADGVNPLEAARMVGLDPVACVPWAAEPALAAFLELHIEQGAVLEAEGLRIGVVDVVAGATRLSIELHGRAEHSGATPMARRADALAAAAEVVLAVEAIGREGRGGTATVGRLEVEPNGVTTIPGRARAVIDLRDVDAGRQRAAAVAVAASAEEIAARRGLGCSVREISWRDPVMLSAWIRQALALACRERGVAYRPVTSGAGHDAAVLAQRAPAGMLFVATPGGRSHVPEEDCRVADVALACPILGDALRALDAQLRAGIESAA
jgi:allantoate deiminase